VKEDNSIKLDYSLETPEERNELVKKIIAEADEQQLTPKYIEILSDYIIFAMDKKERQQKQILTDNRMVTVNKRETSYQGLAGKLENGEDGIYNIMSGGDKNIIFTPKLEITPKDIAEIPPLRPLVEEIKKIEEAEKHATGKKKFLLRKQLIQMRQDQYVIKNEYRKPMYCMNVIKSFNQIDFNENIIIDENGNLKSDGIVSLTNPSHVSALLCNYSKLKEDVWGRFWSDSYYLMEDLDNLIEKTLKDKYPLYYDLLIYKIDGKQNAEIQNLILINHSILYSIEYISSLWRKKIPKLIAKQAQEDYLIWYYTEREPGVWKQCTRCKEIKLAHNMFFSKNASSKDGYYSLCKCCRNKKTKEKMDKN
jgi:hypothetical protein